MRILIIEDLQLKVDELTKFIKELIPNAQVEIKMSYHTGLEEVLNNHNNYDLILLDMSMQNYDISQNEFGGDPINIAGMLILDQMYNNDIKSKVIVVTMYPSFGEGSVSLNALHNRLKSDFPENYLDHVFFNSNDDKWKENLKDLITKNFEIL